MGKHAKNRVKLTESELSAAFAGRWGERFPPLLTIEQAAELLQVSVNTIYHKSSEGKLDDAKGNAAGELRFLRDRLFRLVFEKGI